MNARRCAWILFCVAANGWAAAPIARSQNLTNPGVEKTAGTLIEKRIVDGLSVGYIEGERYGTVHLGSSGQANEKASNLTVYEIGSVSKIFTALLLADAIVDTLIRGWKP